MKATLPGGKLVPLQNCFIETPYKTIYMNVLPDLSDQKNASYADEPVIGRSTGVKTYSHSDTRTISWNVHFIACNKVDLENNMISLRALQACVYPQNGTGSTPYEPPPICKIKCGKLFSTGGNLCVVLRNYSWNVPTDTVWDDETYIPYKFDLSLSFDVVYNSTNLPGAENIFISGF